MTHGYMEAPWSPEYWFYWFIGHSWALFALRIGKHWFIGFGLYLKHGVMHHVYIEAFVVSRSERPSLPLPHFPQAPPAPARMSACVFLMIK